MPDLLRFEWTRDPKGYAIQHVPRANIGQKRTLLSEMIGDKHDVIKGKGGKPESYRPFASGPAIYKTFIDLKNEASILEFANNYGFLAERRGSERLDFWRESIGGMRESVRFAESGVIDKFVERWNRRSPARLAIEFDPIVTDGTPTLRIVPRTLLDALWLQVAQSLASSTSLRQCIECQSWFVFGTGTGRRKSADYCSDRCRKAAWRQRKSNLSATG